MLQKSKIGLTAPLILVNWWWVKYEFPLRNLVRVARWCSAEGGLAAPLLKKTESQWRWMVSQEEESCLTFLSFGESAKVMNWNTDGRSPCEILGGQTLTRCAYTATISLLARTHTRTGAHTHTWTQSCRVTIIHSVRSDSPQWLVTNTGQTLHLPATAHHHTH